MLTQIIAYSSAVALAACLLILLTNGFAVFTRGGWSASSFVSSYLYVASSLLSPWMTLTNLTAISH
jgi:amino acid permease